jgi:hypothetical protein
MPILSRGGEVARQSAPTGELFFNANQLRCLGGEAADLSPEGDLNITFVGICAERLPGSIPRDTAQSIVSTAAASALMTTITALKFNAPTTLFPFCIHKLPAKMAISGQPDR